MSAPASSSASSTATSSLLAAQCSGVSVCGPVNLAFDVGAELGEHRDGRRAVREVAGPVGDHVHQRARHAVGLRRVAEPDGGQAGVRLEQRPQRAVSPVWIARDDRHRHGVVGVHDRLHDPTTYAVDSVVRPRPPRFPPIGGAVTAPVPTTPRIAFAGRILIVGCGAVSRCLQPLLLRHLDMDASRITVIDTDDVSDLIPDTIAAGVTFRQFEIRRSRSPTDALTEFVGPGDLLLNLAWNIDAGVIIGWCQAHGVMYLDTSVEEWDPYREVERPAGAHAVPPALGASRAGGVVAGERPDGGGRARRQPGPRVALGEAGADRDRDGDPRRRGRRDRRRSPHPARPMRSQVATSPRWRWRPARR